MNSSDLNLILGFLRKWEDLFASFLEDEHEIDGSEAGIIVEDFEAHISSVELDERRRKAYREAAS